MEKRRVIRVYLNLFRPYPNFLHPKPDPNPNKNSGHGLTEIRPNSKPISENWDWVRDSARVRLVGIT